MSPAQVWAAQALARAKVWAHRVATCAESVGVSSGPDFRPAAGSQSLGWLLTLAKPASTLHPVVSTAVAANRPLTRDYAVWGV